MVTSVSGNPVVRKPRKHDETDLMRTIHDTLVRVGVTMWRNNVGIATWQSGGKTRYGLGVGSADLIGCYRGASLLSRSNRPRAASRQSKRAGSAPWRPRGGCTSWRDPARGASRRSCGR